MVAGYHIIWTAHGWWLPNDPRGSSSHEIRVEKIAELGELHHGRKEVQPRSRDIRAFYERAETVLDHELLPLSAMDVAIVAAMFGRVLRDCRYTCYGCAIMPDHVHLLIRRHRDKAEQMIENLQNATRTGLIDALGRPENHPVWGGPGWKVFLNTRDDMQRIVDYIRNNPKKAGLPPQPWRFVTPYEGWMPWGAE